MRANLSEMSVIKMGNNKPKDSPNFPKVSIGLPTYNRPDFLKRSIENLGKQTYANWELIVSDDSRSGAENRQIVEHFQKLGFSIKYHKPDKNLGAALNHKRVLDLSDGEYFFWASDDDLFDSRYIEKGITALIENPDVSCWACSFVNANSFGHVTRTYPSMKRWTSTKSKFLDLLKYLSEPEGLGKALIFHGIFRTESLKSVANKYFISDRDHASDYPFVFSFLIKNKVLATDEILLFKTIIDEKDSADVIPVVQQTLRPSWGTFYFQNCHHHIYEYIKASKGSPYMFLAAIVMICRVPIAFRNRYYPSCKKLFLRA
ncbi:MAG: glycosyltransferase [Bdellovibrionota bacterium]